MDGVLYRWKDKGHTLELAGNDTVNGLLAYKIKVTRKDGGVEYQFIDQKSYLPLKKLSYRKAGGRELPVENYYRDYRDVEGIPFAFTVENNNAGRVNEIQYESIELNKPVDLKIFTLPEIK